MFKVTAAQNGYVIELEDGEFVLCMGDTEQEEFLSLLQTISNHFGPPDSRYDKNRVRINLFPGDKCDELPPECPLCWQKIPHPVE